ncbi:adenosylcobinamide-phosphate synthase CbiB [Sandaracinobacteroides hominis]|uniref:adenosylcobinamide-phosphate synthase CbiB n=1 Tax=Sandaracinobacteroides hominis TaxID=2780086 RepID=UPI001F287D80|nr:adenosylcobinamide-phosphate synthase CbiB [Sandaracinobacteroides hominis]
MAEPTGLLALAIDAAIGWPRGLYARVGHPVGFFARVITWWEGRFNRSGWTDAKRRSLGLLLLLVLVATTFALALLLEQLMWLWLGRWGWIGVAVLAWPALAQRSLWQHVQPIAGALAQGDLRRAREYVAMIVGRDVAGLDEAGVSRAAIESLAESFCDGVVAPLFWLLLLGLPGVWAWKAINTADSLIGHREERWRAFGWAAARADDLACLLPARISGGLICLAGGGGWRVMWRDCRRHASPNAGWPEAAMAGTLGVALAGPLAYDGVMHAKPWIGGEGRTAGGHDISRALRIYVVACGLLWLIAGGYAWLL